MPAPEGEGPDEPPARPLVEQRLHFVTPLRRTWAPIAVLTGWLVHDVDQAQRWAGRLTLSTGALLIAGLLVASALYGFLSWWFTHFAITDTELRIRTGLVFRRTVHIRLDRIQAVDVNQPLLARVIGVSKLKLDVIGSQKKDELAYLGEREARDLRAELLARAAGLAPETADTVGEAPSQELVRVAPGTLVVASLLSAAVWVAVGAFLVVPAGLYLATGDVWLPISVGIPLLGWAWAAGAGRVIKEYDWTVAESPDGLRVDHGLLDRSHETVPPGRVQTVRIVEPLLWRRRDWVRVELDVAGSSDNLLLPVAPRELAYAVIARILPGVEVPALLDPPPRRARWCTPLWWRGYGLAVTDAVFASRHGLLHRTLSLVPHAKVQSVRTEQGPWQRRHGVAHVYVETGANGSVRAHQRDAAEATALLFAQADRSRTGRREARPDRWMT
ncbi:PH domain-containing protein [Streptomyces sp. NPDC060194]|uniref:PH domain-containing protein n=1 Tax=Streptomyces sp. NPDC060194 TaxID=3347069 RepID=UPI00364D72DC